jgi:hypothetical protein
METLALAHLPHQLVLLEEVGIVRGILAIDQPARKPEYISLGRSDI